MLRRVPDPRNCLSRNNDSMFVRLTQPRFGIILFNKSKLGLMLRDLKLSFRALRCLLAVAVLMAPGRASAEALLQLFNVNWDELTTKIPEIAEAGYTSLWLPPPAKAGSVYSVGYDLFDPFDLGDKDQRGTIRTKYGTKTELLEMIAAAHRFGLRVYFDNLMNHRGFDVPRYNFNTPTNLYPGLTVEDFHLRRQLDGTFRNWDQISDYGNLWQVQNRPLAGLLDLATEGGSINLNFGLVEGNTANKVSFLRQPGSNSYYMDADLPALAGPWRPFNGANGDPVIEDLNAHLIRAAMWMVNETKCDGFRFDAVKHPPSAFFGDTSATANGYVGGIQTIFDYVHGYGNNFIGNGYVETNDNRNSCFDAEAVRNDALLFGEHLGEPPSYSDYLWRGMRLLDSPLSGRLNTVLGNPSESLFGLDQPDSGGFAVANRVMYAQSHDNGFANRRELQLAYMFMREGIPLVYSDGYNESFVPPAPEQPFPRHADAPYLGQFGDNKMPDLAWLHHQVARGKSRARWSDNDIVAFERYDHREPGSEVDQTTVLFVMNDNYSGAVSFDDGVGQTTSGTYYECFPVSNSRGVGLAVAFPPGTVLHQLADSPDKNAACSKLLVRNATATRSLAETTWDDANPVNRAIYVGGQFIPPGGGAIELKIPAGSYVVYGIEWPEASRANNGKDAIILRQGSAEAPRVILYRKDGVNGDAAFNPLYPYKMRGSVDSHGSVVTGSNLSNRTYSIEVPIITNGPVDLVFQTDASCNNGLAKLDGGVDVNSQIGFGPLGGFDKRDNKPGSSTDVFLGYEQTEFQSRLGPEKFAAMTTNRNNTVSDGAETYHYKVGWPASNRVVFANGTDWAATNGTAEWTWHSPSNAPTFIGGAIPTQRHPLDPPPGQQVDIYMRAGYQFQIDKCYLYYTTDGSNPEGAFGAPRGTTKVVQGSYVQDDTSDGTIDWWRATIPAADTTANATIAYKIAVHKSFVLPISDGLDAKRYGLTTFALTNFNPAAPTIWLHNNLNSNHTATGLSEGLHVIRARAFLPRDGKASVFNTFVQTFYYDAAPPGGAVAFPAAGGAISNSTYSIVIRSDNSVTGVEVNIQDSNPLNDDSQTGQNNGNGNTNGTPKFVVASAVTPNDGISANYPNLPKEYRFNYVNVPDSGPATITVRLKEAASAIFSNRFTTLTRTVSTFAPQSVLYVSAPATDGMILTLNAGANYAIRNCYSTNLPASSVYYSIYLNGQLLPRANYTFLNSGCAVGFRSVNYLANGLVPGTNVVFVTYTNSPVYLEDTRTFVVVRPGDSDGDGMSDYNETLAGTDPYNPGSILRITELANGNKLVVWDSVAGRTYRVLATTDIAAPMQVISSPIQAGGPSTFYFDTASEASNKFYRIQLVP